jgi:hypothetical protein
MSPWNRTVAFFKYWWNQWFGKSQSTKTLPKEYKRTYNIYEDFDAEYSNGYRSARNSAPYITGQQGRDPILGGSSWVEMKRTKCGEFNINLSDLQKRARDMSNEEFRKMFLANTDKITTWRRTNGNAESK